MANEVDDVIPININIIDIENFLSESWEKSNPGGFLTIEENKITATDLPRGLPIPGAWVKKDFGVAGVSADFIHEFTVHIESSTPGALYTFWAVSNTPDLNTHMERSTAGDGIAIYTYEATGYPSILHFRDMATGLAGGHSYVAPFTGYITVYKVGGTVYMNVYSDYERTNLLTAVSRTTEDLEFRFVFAAANRHISEVPEGAAIIAYVEDMWLVD